MLTLIDGQQLIVLGNHAVHDVKTIHGMDDLPPELDGKHLLSLRLPSIPITTTADEVREREFHLCYSPQHSFLFVVETEMTKHVESTYRPQYGANVNYDTRTIVQRIVWLYGIDSPRAKDPVVAQHLKEYLPTHQ